MTCRRVAPTARRSPTSRMRSDTAIESVLKMRNAPTKSTTAATSASVVRKSPVSPRSRSAISDGSSMMYGSYVSRLSSTGDDRVGRDVEGEVDVHGGDRVRVEERLRGLERDPRGPPERRRHRAVPGDDADDPERLGRARAVERDGAPEVEAAFASRAPR